MTTGGIETYRYRERTGPVAPWSRIGSRSATRWQCVDTEGFQIGDGPFLVKTTPRFVGR